MATPMLKDKVAVVTGAARGIGREIALLMAQHGAKVVVNDYGGGSDGTGRDHGPADEVVSAIKGIGGQAAANYDSVATMAGGQAIVQTALDHFGSIDIVVNNAGILRDRMIFNMTEEEWDAVIDTHLKGSFSVTRAAVPHMREKKWGRLINMTSTSGLVGNVGQANYAAAKLGIVGLTTHRDGGAEDPRGQDQEDGARAHRPRGRVSRQRGGQGGLGPDLRRPRQGDHALRPHAAHPEHPSRPGLDTGAARRDLPGHAQASPRPAGDVGPVLQLRPPRLGQVAEKGPSASLAPSVARSTYREYASRATFGRRLASGPF